MLLDEKALKALDRLEILVRERLKAVPQGSNDYHTHPEGVDFNAMLGWIREVRENHTNPYCASSVESGRQYLRKMVMKYGFDLSEKEKP